jgi:hypothetical protein
MYDPLSFLPLPLLNLRLKEQAVLSFKDVPEDGQSGKIISNDMSDVDVWSQASGRLLRKSPFPGCSKRARCKAPEILRSEAYLAVRCNDEG